MDLPLGIYEQVINKAIECMLESDRYGVSKDPIPFEGSPDILSRYLQKALKKALVDIRDRAGKGQSGTDDEKNRHSVRAEIDSCNRIIRLLSEISDNEDLLDWTIGESGETLLALWDRKVEITRKEDVRPAKSISISSLFTGGRDSFHFSSELGLEIRSADEVDFLVSFIKNSGVNRVEDALKEFTNRGGRLRILTTTYMGATEPTAVARLAKLPNTQIKISYDGRSTRLHAKSYVFKRNNGFTTAFVGSSNLSAAAISDGMEWNLKITNQDAPQVITSIEVAFDTYWNSKDFESFDSAESYQKLRDAVRNEIRGKSEPGHFAIIDVTPRPYQEQVLSKLQAEREIHGRYRNLVVAATGTGKTMISALDYRRFANANPGKVNGLLFIAHRKEILDQSADTFNIVMKDPNFSSKMYSGESPEGIEHLFLSVQTFNSRDFIDVVPPDYYDYIVVDETHHASASSYESIFTYFKPKILLGLTATPFRMDGDDIRRYFDNTVAANIPLSEAIDREMLVPFQYFAVDDPTDISRIRITNTKACSEELNDVYVNNQKRVRIIVDAIHRYQPEIDKIKGIGFCVSKEHARFMADQFNALNLSSIALTSDSGRDIREEARDLLRRGDIKFIFVVDIYNEGVDIPEVNTELFLRPTESLTVFIQQLGRGLRISEGKSELTVLDFVGQADKSYQVYEQKLEYMASCSALSLAAEVSEGFPGLPAGCFIKMEKRSKEYVLGRLKETRIDKHLVSALQELGRDRGRTPTLYEFLDEYSFKPEVIYKKQSYTSLCIEAQLIDGPVPESEKVMVKALRSMMSINSRRWISAIRGFLNGTYEKNEVNRRFATMLYFSACDYNNTDYDDVWKFVEDFRRNPRYRS